MARNTKITEEEKTKAIEAIREHGTMREGAKASGVSVWCLNEEMKRSATFKTKLMEAREEGKRNIADKAVGNIKDCAFGDLMIDKTRLTANIALANAYAEGFRKPIEHKVEGEIKVTSAVPRPQ